MDDGSLPTIGYAGALGRHGVVVDRGPGRLRLVVPRRVTPGEMIGLVSLGAYGATAFVEYVASVWHGRWADFNVLAPAVGLAGLVAYLKYRHEPTTLTLTGDELRIDGLRRPGDRRKPVTIVRQRREIYRVYYVDWAKSLFVRAHGREMLEVPLPAVAAVGQEIAAILSADLGLPDEEPLLLRPHPLA